MGWLDGESGSTDVAQERRDDVVAAPDGIPIAQGGDAMTRIGGEPAVLDEGANLGPVTDLGTGDNTAALPLMEEQVRISKRDVVTGKVRVRTVTDATEQLVRQELDTEHVAVTRVPVDRIVQVAPQVRTDGDVTIVPVLEEILVVETKLLLKEEIHIRRTTTRDAVEEFVTLRKQRVVVENEDGG